MIMKSHSELAKVHCMHSLFGILTGRDPYLTSQIKTAIEFSLTGSADRTAPLDSFTKAALDLFKKQSPLPPSWGFAHLDLSLKPFDPLWVRAAFVKSLKNLAGYEDALLVVSGLRISLCPEGKYWTRRVQNRYENALSYIDDLAAKWSTPNTTLTVLYL